MEKNKIMIRSGAAEFLIFERQKKETGVEVRFENGDLWLTQREMSELYNCSVDNISLHLKNIYMDMELDKIFNYRGILDGSYRGKSRGK